MVTSPAMSAAALSLIDRLSDAQTVSSMVRMIGVHACPKPDLSMASRDVFVYGEYFGAGHGGWTKVMTGEEIMP